MLDVPSAHVAPTGARDAEFALPPRSRFAAAALAIAGLVVFATLMGLGTWQVYRLRWKLDLIARVDARVRAAPEAPPAPSAWPEVTADSAQYRHVAIRGTFDHADETTVQAVTDYGPGFWLLTPFRTDAGFTVLVNRGFVPPERRDPGTRAAGQIAGLTTVTGLLRVTEPGGAFLRRNDAAGGRWYSRDVAAIAEAHSLTGRVAPYFVDADAAPNPGGVPIGGLTVISFPNNHLVYALTWYALGLMLAGAAWWVVRDGRRSRSRVAPSASAP